MQVQCPGCRQVVQAADEHAGKIVKCPSCGAQMQLPGAPASIPPSPPPPPASPQVFIPSPAPMPAPIPDAPQAGGAQMRPCRFCGEQILAVARKCKHCGSMVDGGPGAAPPRPGVAPAGQGKSKMAAGLRGIFLGAWGVHRFYLGYTGIGITQIIVTLVTCGIGSFWGFIEGILILCGTSITTDASGAPLQD